MMKSIVVGLIGILLISFGVIQTGTNGSVGLAGQEKVPLIQDQRMTEKEKEHSRLFEKYGTGKNLRTLAEAANGDVKVVSGIDRPLPLLSPFSRPEYPSPYLIDVACDAEAVVVGVLKNGSPHLTENQEFLFTDYTMLVERVLKDNNKAQILEGKSITVTRAGGTAEINGRVVRAIDPFFSNFVAGERYLLVLRFIPVTGAYEAFDEGSFSLKNHKVEKLTRQPRWSGKLFQSQDETAFISEVKDAVASDCNSATKGVAK